MRKLIGILTVLVVLGGASFVRSGVFASWLAQRRLEQMQNALKKSGLKFEEISKRAGIQFSYGAPHLSEVLRPEDLHIVGAGVAVADVNGDGFMDFYVVTAGAGGANQLYLNKGDGTFQEVAASWGIRDLNLTTEIASPNPIVPPKQNSFASLFPIFFDFNNDGLPDLLVAGLGGIKMFRNLGARFESAGDGMLDRKNAQAMVPLDYDRDGFTDLYVVRYFSDRDLFNTLDDDAWVNSSYNATNGGSNTLYKNNGDGTFTDVTAQTGGGDTHWGFDAAAGDFFGDAGLELLISNDFGPDVLYEIKDGKFRDISGSLGVPDRRLGMGVSFGFLDQSARPYVHVSNAFHPGYRHEGNFLWHFDAEHDAHDEALTRGSNYCLWAWGSVFGDFDLDGQQDLYVTNGFVSGNERREFVPDIYAVPPGQTTDASFKMGTLQALPGAVLNRGSVFSSMFRGEADVGKLSFAGYQPDCLFLNQGGSFTDVAPQVGLTERTDGRAAATIDFDNNGALDLLITTRNNGVELYHNLTEPRSRWLGLQLIDARGNSLVTGAEVTFSQAGSTWRRYATGGKSGLLAMSDPRIHVGLTSEMPVDVEVRWPSGKIQKLPGLSAGIYHRVREPA